MMAGAAVGIMALGLAGCSGGAKDDGASAGGQEPLTLESATGTWVLVDGKGPEGEVKPIEDDPIRLTVESDGTFSGDSGCNSIMGTMTVTDGVVDLGAIGQTMMACEEDVMKLEYAYTQALDSVTAGTASADDMTLRGDKSELHYKRD